MGILCVNLSQWDLLHQVCPFQLCAVSTGRYVTAGTVIGYEGDTGNVTGLHLHFEVYENGTLMDPARFL